MEKLKKWLAFALCIVMMLGIVPTYAFAASTDKVEVTKDGVTTYYTTLQAAFDYIDGYDTKWHVGSGEVGGTYKIKLLADVDRAEMSAKTYLGEPLDVTLDLNGHSVISSTDTKSVMSITIGDKNNHSVFTVTDSVGGGEIRDGKQGIVFSGAYATLNFNGGKITNNHGGTTGGGITCSTNSAIININGGEISGNSVKGTSSANTGLGGGVCGYNINVTGGVITGNYAYGGTGNYTGRGGGICTQITGLSTAGYNYVNITGGQVYGNFADNAGDDVMAQKNGRVNHELHITTDGWYLDGWNGKSQSVGETARYDASNPVAYTTGGFERGMTNNVGLKYIAPAEADDKLIESVEILDVVAPVAGETAVHSFTLPEGANYSQRYDSNYCAWIETSSKPESFNDLARASKWYYESLTFKAGKYYTVVAILKADGDYSFAENVTATVNGNAANFHPNETFYSDSVWYTFYVEETKPEQPALPDISNVEEELVKIVCDSDSGHASVYQKWLPYACKVNPSNAQPVWDDAVGAWTIGVRINQLPLDYIGSLEDANGGIKHTSSVSEILTTLKWDADKSLWVKTEALELHTTCTTVPAAPVHDQVDGFQVGVHGDIAGEEKKYFFNLIEGTYTIGAVKGNREDGFTVDLVFNAFADGDAYQTAWLNKFGMEAGSFCYDMTKTPAEFTLTLYYNGSLSGTLDGTGSTDWVIYNAKGSPINYGPVLDVYLSRPVPPMPEKYCGNIENFEKFVTVTCDTDHGRHPDLFCKIYGGNNFKVTSATPEWNEELQAWTVNAVVSKFSIFYADQMWDTYNVYHDVLNDELSREIVLKWDADKQLWVATEDFVIHTTCKTVPDAPLHYQLSSYQVSVYGYVNGVLKQYTTSIPEGAYTVGEVYGSREEGFFVDITVNPLVDGDIYQTNWIEKRNPGFYYHYDWALTSAEPIVYTLEYNGDLNGTLYGNRNAVNTNVDWIWTEGTKNNQTWGVVGEAYLKQDTCTVNVVIYRNGDVTKAYKTISLGQVPKGTELDLSQLNIADYYTSANGFEFDGWFNDGKWNQYKVGNLVTGLDTVTVNGWTNLICMVTDYERIVVKEVTSGDKDNATTIFTGLVLHGTDLVEWLEENVTIPAKTGYTADQWYNWDWYGHKVDENATVRGWTNVYITYTANTYSIKYNGGEGVYTGSEPNSGSNWMILKNAYTVDAPVALYNGSDFSRVGYTLTGWEIGGTVYALGETVEKNFTVVQGGTVQAYAVWTANEYTLTFDADGGKVDPSTLTVTFDAAIGTLPVPTKTGYTFNGWFDAEGNEVTAETVYTVAADSTVTAKWTANQYTVTFDANGGACEPTTLTVTYDAAVGVMPEPTLTGYTFIGWFDAADNRVTADTVYTVDGDSTLTAKWSANAYTITLDPNGGQIITTTVNVVYNEAVNTLPVPTKTGYTFNGWFDAEGNEVTAETVYTVAGDITVTAKWTANQYTLTFDANGGEVDPTTLTVTFDAAVGTLPTPTLVGHTFAGWFDAEGNEVTAETLYTVAGDITVTAKWTVNTYTVTLNTDGGELENSTVTATFGEAIGELPTPTKEGYTFAGWVDAEGNAVTAETVYTATADMELTATWNAVPVTGDGMMGYVALAALILLAAGVILSKKRRIAE